ncbi:hypothetical protein Q4E93_30460 [Flavitalea sp. BT771]|uniref:hypothetical protein n=1 Tax=Flavitalea sp. BT771 TaxID=3063329 RepID=UPI0026E1F299|nr:hypothetical protein [Flavitalea sp. BT771]MDO6434976.1 hypothetical protein [Flavitalea sp. BT771]MDV6223876.1 hypothetical protein [Flavitalea sp. BT771]
MTSWSYIVLCLSLALLALLLVKEVQRDNRARVFWRVIANIVLVASLAAIALPIGYTRRSLEGSKEGILLTEGYNMDSIKSKAPVWVAPEDVKGQGLSRLHVYGYGLTREECARLPDVPLVFHPSSLQAGIVSIHWKRSLWPGEACRIQGRFFNAQGTPVKLLLTGMGTMLDSAEISSGAGGYFELRTLPVQVGRAVYHLIALSGADTLEQESISVKVSPGKGLKILLLAAAPDFENRFLAHWLSEKGHGVTIRTAISKGKYDHVSLNMAVEQPDHLTPALLDKFDVVVADAAELKAIGSREYAILRRQVAGKGLGLIIKADSTSLGHGARALGGNDSVLRMVVTDKPGDRPMIKDSQSRTLVSANMYGAGKIILMTLNGTYVRLLSGDKKDYSALWTSILQEAAGDAAVTERWQITPDLPAVDQPMKVLLQSAGSSLPQALIADDDEQAGARPVAVYLAQDPLLPFAWEGSYWPRKAGWQTVRTSQGSPSWWYVWGKDDWHTLRRTERMRETAAWISQNGRRGGGHGEREAEIERVLISKGWFYLLFLLCCVFLWVERKI